MDVSTNVKRFPLAMAKLIAIRAWRRSLDREHPLAFRPSRFVSQFQELVRIDVPGTRVAQVAAHDFSLEIALDGIFLNTGHTTFRST
mgnify:CR=1 FL=1